MQQEYFDKLLNDLHIYFEDKDGKNIRQIVAKLRRDFQGKGLLLSQITSEYQDPILNGVVSSVRYSLDGSMEHIRKHRYGGLGATFTKTPERVNLDHSQGWFALVKGTALQGSINSGNALWFAESDEYALANSNNSEKALTYSKNAGNSLRASLNRDESLALSSNFGNSLKDSINSGYSLFGSTNSENTLQSSRNSQNALQGSINSGNALSRSRNIENTLQYSTVSGLALRFAKFAELSLAGANCQQSYLPELRDYSPVKKAVTARKSREMTLEEVAERFHVSEERIRNIESVALRKLKKKLLKSLGSAGWYLSHDENVTKEVLMIISELERLSIPEYNIYHSGFFPWVTRYPAYSADLRESDNIGMSSRQGNLVSFRDASFNTKILWAVRNGLIPLEE